jgi:hypothetical protein
LDFETAGSKLLGEFSTAASTALSGTVRSLAGFWKYASAAASTP